MSPRVDNSCPYSTIFSAMSCSAVVPVTTTRPGQPSVSAAAADAMQRAALGYSDLEWIYRQRRHRRSSPFREPDGNRTVEIK